MGPLPEDTPFDEVLPLLTVFFGQSDHVEESVMAAIAEDLNETPFWLLVEEAVESGHLSPEEIHSEFQTFLRDELSQASWLELREIDRAFLQAAALGDSASLWILGLRLMRASNSSIYLEEQEDLDQDGLFLIVEAAEAGHARAQWMLGERFSRMKDGLDESIRLLGMAAVQGFKLAAERLEELFDSRFAFVHAASERKWLLRFARAGLARAQFELANDLYLSGELKSAFAWMLQAANASHHQAQQRLAFFYEVGQGCSRNRGRAEYWKNLSQFKEALPPVTVAEHETLESGPALLNEPIEGPPAAASNLAMFESAITKSDGIGSGQTDPGTTSPVLTVEEAVLAEETIQQLTPDGSLVEVPLQVGEQESTQADGSQLCVAVTVRSGDQPGLASRFRSGLAGVLRRLADKIGNSTSPVDGDQ